MMAVHPSPFSGSWYPERAGELRSLLEDLFERSSRRVPFVFPNGVGFVVPHAGPAYSGTVAAAAYRAIRAQAPERIVLLAFPHRGGLKGVAAPDVKAISTPLGEVEIERPCADFPSVAESRVCDHSLEIQLPFLQWAAPRARIAALYVGRLDHDERAAAAQTLAALWRPGVVFVASSDFTHYGSGFGFTPFPPEESGARLRELDFECAEAAGTFDAGHFLGVLEQNGATVCGAAPIALLLETLRRISGSLYQTTLDYQTSGELTRDFHHTVSYAALGYFPRESFDLCATDREALLDSAAATLRRLRATRESAPAAARGSAALAARRGVFVSLHQRGDLLGCIGRAEGSLPLAEEAPEMALAAALDDPRFQPAAWKAGPIDVEISVLTPFRRIFREEECRVGEHGLCLKLGARSGLLLPQVAAERNWSAEEFLEAVSRKSMLPPRAWRDPEARLYVFGAQVFSRAGAG
ncbi:MAG TPA: AmmeMemoRadiSam system protein B [Bryobacteraceae bacterium]|nr:AmmeMemoRadiSam system protein B [Bryobacteraceae bacterium]